MLHKPEEYRSILGALQFVTITRLEITFLVNKLCQFGYFLKTNHWEVCKRLLKCLNGTVSCGLHLQVLVRRKLIFNGFANRNWANDRKLCCECSFLRPNLVSWSSKLHLFVAKSSNELEYRSLTIIAVKLRWLFKLSKEQQLNPERPIIWFDNL